MVAANNIRAPPIYRLFIIDIEKYARNEGTANNDEPPEPVDIFIPALLARKEIQNRPDRYEKESDAVPVKVSMYSF